MSHKISIVGNSNVGKTQFINRITKNIFHSHCKSNSVDFSSLTKQSMKNKYNNIFLLFWDMSSVSIFFDLLGIYLENSKSVIIMCDVENKLSIDNTIDWLEMVRKYTGIKCHCYLVFNKIDLINSDNEDQIISYCNEFVKINGELFDGIFYVSCKEPYNLFNHPNDVVDVLCEDAEKYSLLEKIFDDDTRETDTKFENTIKGIFSAITNMFS